MNPIIANRTSHEIAEAARLAILSAESEAKKAEAAGHDIAYAIHSHAGNVLREVVWPGGFKPNLRTRDVYTGTKSSSFNPMRLVCSLRKLLVRWTDQP